MIQSKIIGKGVVWIYKAKKILLDVFLFNFFKRFESKSSIGC